MAVRPVVQDERGRQLARAGLHRGRQVALGAVVVIGPVVLIRLIAAVVISVTWLGAAVLAVVVSVGLLIALAGGLLALPVTRLVAVTALAIALLAAVTLVVTAILLVTVLIAVVGVAWTAVVLGPVVLVAIVLGMALVLVVLEVVVLGGSPCCWLIARSPAVRGCGASGSTDELVRNCPVCSDSDRSRATSTSP